MLSSIWKINMHTCNIVATVPTPSLCYKDDTHLVPVDGTGRWRRLRGGRKDQMEEVGKPH